MPHENYETHETNETPIRRRDRGFRRAAGRRRHGPRVLPGDPVQETHTALFGYGDEWGITASYQYHGLGFDIARGAATIAREAAITLLTGGAGRLAMAGQGGVFVSGAYNLGRGYGAYQAGSSGVSGIQSVARGNYFAGSVQLAVATLGARGAAGAWGRSAAPKAPSLPLSASRGLSPSPAPVVIGETMKRVQSTAAQIPGAKILDDMPDFAAMGLSGDKLTSAMMQYNRRWILEQMRSGRPILDIGADASRITRSSFYQMEQAMIRNYQKLHPDFAGRVTSIYGIAQ